MIFLFIHMFTSACVLIFCVIVLLLLNNQSSTKMKCDVRASPFLIAILPLLLCSLTRFSHFHNNVFIYFYISIKSIIPSLSWEHDWEGIDEKEIWNWFFVRRALLLHTCAHADAAILMCVYVCIHHSQHFLIGENMYAFSRWKNSYLNNLIN